MTTRILTVSKADAGQSILDWLRARLRISDQEARQLIAARKIRVGGNPCSNPTWRLRAGQRVEIPHRSPSSSPQRIKRFSPPVIHHVDDHIVIVDKPAGLTTMRHADEAAEFGQGRRYLPNTLADLLPGLLAERLGQARAVRAVHRLDKDTTGLVVFALTRQAESQLGGQFRAHSIERLYQAVVRGRAEDARLESWLIPDRGDGRRGSAGKSGEGQQAITHVRVVEQLGDFSLVECRLETGRTHQVRIHLGEAGTPLCGERIYDRPLHGRPVADGSGIKRVALHASVLGLDHPNTGVRLRWTTPLPSDMAQLAERLRGQS